MEQKLLYILSAVVLLLICAAGIIFFLQQRRKGSVEKRYAEASEKGSEPEGRFRCASCIGQGNRGYQEDSLWISEAPAPNDPVIAVIADGMGGMQNSAESSAKVIEIFQKETGSISEEDLPEKLRDLCIRINREVFELNSRRNMEGGSTLAAVWILNDRLWWVSVGDSRIYLFRQGILSSVTEEHEVETSLYAQVLAGMTDLKNIRETPNAELRKLISHLGGDSVPLVDQNLSPFRLKEGDRLLLCSDGVSGTLSEKELAACLALPDPDAACRRISEMIEDRDKRGQDNYSAIAILFTP